MFGFGLHPAFLIVLFIIVLVVFGPGKLPEVAGAVGRTVREFRRASDDVTREIRTALDLPEGQGNNLFSAQGLIDQLTKEPEERPVSGVAVPLEADAAEGDAANHEHAAAEEAGPETGDEVLGPPEIEAAAYASSYHPDATGGGEPPVEEPGSAGEAEAFHGPAQPEAAGGETPGSVSGGAASHDGSAPPEGPAAIEKPESASEAAAASHDGSPAPARAEKAAGVPQDPPHQSSAAVGEASSPPEPPESGKPGGEQTGEGEGVSRGN